MADLFELIELMVDAGRRADATPDFYVFRTTQRAVCYCGPRLAGDVVRALESAVGRERGRPRDWPLEYGRYLRRLESVAPVKSVRAGPLFRLTAPPAGGEAAVRITPGNADLLRGGLDEWLPDVASGRLICAVVVGGRAVSICASVRVGGPAHAAGVETLPEFRGRGLAAQAVAAWARRVLESGGAPFYGTTFDNLASLGVARRLGMPLVGSEFSVECDFGER